MFSLLPVGPTVQAYMACVLSEITLTSSTTALSAVSRAEGHAGLARMMFKPCYKHLRAPRPLHPTATTSMHSSAPLDKFTYAHPPEINTPPETFRHLSAHAYTSIPHLHSAALRHTAAHLPTHHTVTARSPSFHTPHRARSPRARNSRPWPGGARSQAVPGTRR